MFNVIFVILHYQNIDDTINCINSIKKLQGLDSNYKIILVDNKSPNNTGKELEKKYINDSNIETVLLEKNYGFSKANNIAFKKAKEYNPEIVLVLNNDIIFEDNNFLLNLSKICKNSKKYDIICPDIINLKDEHQNPMKEKEMNIGKAYKNMLYEFLFYLLMNVYGIRNIVANRRKKREEKWFENYYKETLKNKICLDNFIPFGAFIIYTNQWIKNEERAFVSDTFMYMEEDMLGIYIKQKKYRMLYSEGLKVRHLEGRSTQNTNENQYKVLKFKSINKAKALYKYIMFCKKMKKGKM
ncbi:MAG: hypothetical protein BHW01_07270 [Clostridium sp. 27_14]|nr:MAG: hypothetical protein BHW01_07270 [Clostridium sp. 27_14]